ncbi:MAG: hypothetical protein ABID79_04925 [Elusimicrobiota bacterium]
MKKRNIDLSKLTVEIEKEISKIDLKNAKWIDGSDVINLFI